MRDDTALHNWKKLSSVMDTEADAEAAIKQFFQFPGATSGIVGAGKIDQAEVGKEN